MTLVADPIPMNDLSRSWLATSEEAGRAAARVIASGWYLNGPEVAGFERELADYIGIDYAVGVGSGTDALAIAMLAVGCSGGSQVVAAANAGGYSSIAAAQIGAVMSYADVDSDTLVVTADSIAAAAGPNTKAVVVTHLYGNVARVDEIAALCRRLGIALIEDCAQALGARIGGRSVGTFGEAAALSFYPTKNLGGAGDGGAVVTRDNVMAEAARSIRQYGWGEKYQVIRPYGRNSRLDEVQAAVLRVGLTHLDDLTARRQEIVARYRACLNPAAGRMVSGATTSHVAHLAVLRVKGREAFRDRLGLTGIATDIHYPIPDHLQTGLPPAASTTSLPETELASDEILTIPCFPEMTEAEVDRVCAALEDG